MPKKKPPRRQERKVKAKPKKPRISNARRRLAVANFLARTAPETCGECGKPVGPAGAIYQRDPITGRRSASKWCDSCYERALLAGGREARPLRKVA